MALSISAADAYISENVIDTEDWTDSDVERKQRLLNVAHRTLEKRFKPYKIPDVAVYEFSAYLASVFNDTYKMQQYGVKQFSIKGIAFTFDGSLAKDLNALIPQSVFDLVGEENGVVLSRQRIGRSVR
ncbi:hypothetical protein AC621_20845 [Bacillus sp. FJAT-27445]|uniref:hypothetical protein n=1 Tax=Bacillus sp. FJAT-27445 TaxID=1679166 RepID=UPI00067174CB|nr:hypothetical protein [Bacillus sp. FJAT-27445]KMY40220.1 hypothetical protein AC621_20845 [Bacillus sp. FJAT-27445]